MDGSSKLAIPVGIVIAFILSIVSGMLSWARGSKQCNMLEASKEKQEQFHTCLITLARESTKQTTLLEQIANHFTQQRR
jgi:hypothetical protein